jgi:hypothetical protein
MSFLTLMMYGFDLHDAVIIENIRLYHLSDPRLQDVGWLKTVDEYP